MNKKSKIKMKKCRECGGRYKSQDTEIKIKLNHLDIEALEDRLFCKLTEKQYKKTNPKIHKIWKQICNQEELLKMSDL